MLLLPLSLLLLLMFVPAEGELRSIAQGLCNFNGKQLQAVGHLLSDEHIKQIKIGMDIPPTNQVLQTESADAAPVQMDALFFACSHVVRLAALHL